MSSTSFAIGAATGEQRELEEQIAKLTERQRTLEADIAARRGLHISSGLLAISGAGTSSSEMASSLALERDNLRQRLLKE